MNIPTVHLTECPEPPAYMPDDKDGVVYLPPDNRTFLSWSLLLAQDLVLVEQRDDPDGFVSASYRMF